MQGFNHHARHDISNRLARVEGQVRGIRRLIDEEADCEKIAQQMAAARKALDKAFHEMLACMIEHAVIQQRDATTADVQMAQIRTLLSKYA